MNRIALLYIAVFLLVSPLFGDPAPNAFGINARLGKGINLGNMFEAPSEGDWGEVWKPEDFDIIKELGFSHVRIPIRWETAARSSENPPYEIDSGFMDRITEVVDAALARDLMVIINMHHHDGLFADPEGQKPRFLAQWKQISEQFRGYPDGLLFEVLNEPHGNLTPELWNDFFADALKVIRETNPKRTVVMGTAEYGGLQGVPFLRLPDDKNLILSVHYYNPFRFTHQGAEWSGEEAKTWLGTKWRDTEAERRTVVNEFTQVIGFSKQHNIPVHIGEYGAYHTADMDSRVRWTRFLSNWFADQGFSAAYWEYNAGFGIYDPKAKQLRRRLADAILRDPLPEAEKVPGTTVYSWDSAKGKNGFALQLQGPAMGVLTTADNAMKVLITNGGTESWHVQLVKREITLEKGKTYLLSFTAAGPDPRAATVYFGKNSSPWNAYSDYRSIQLGEKPVPYSFSFTMSEKSDSRARLVFDLGMQKEGMLLYALRLEELE